MRRILAILIIIIVVFLVLYGIVPPVKAAVDGFFIDFVGPESYSILNTAYATVITSIGVAGFAAMVLTFGFGIGMVVHFLWVKADWRLRRWGHTRTAKDLGVSPVTHISTTPPTATTRPEPPAEVVQPVVQETKPVEATKESEKT